MIAGEASALADRHCKTCQGKGTDLLGEICGCVDRAVFRICIRRAQCAPLLVSPDYACTLARNSWGRPAEEYVADVVSTAERALQPDQRELFRLHYLMRADTGFCARKLGTSEGGIKWSLWRIRETLGREFRTMQPYPLYPLAEYFRRGMREYNPRVKTAAA